MAYSGEIKFDVEGMTKIKNELAAKSSEISSKYRNDVSIISSISSVANREEVNPALQSYITANESKSSNIATLLSNVDAWLEEKIPQYEGINQEGVDTLSSINSRLESLGD